MRKIGWYAVSAVVGLIILGGLLLLAANLYVQSQSVQQRIRSALEASLKVPVSLRKTTVTPWEGLRLDGIVLHSPEAGKAAGKQETPDFLTATSFRVRCAWWPLIREGRFEIEQVLLDQPKLVWQQNADGRWEFPPGREAVKPPKTEGHKPKKTATPTPGEETPPASPEPPTGSPETPVVVESTPAPPIITSRPLEPDRLPTVSRDTIVKGYPLVIDKLRLRHGAADILDRHRHPLVQLEEINADGRLTDPHRATGAFWIDKVSVPGTGVTLNKYWMAYVLDDKEGFTFRDGRGELAGGELRASCHFQPRDPGTPFAASVRLENVALKQLLRTSGGGSPLMAGLLHCRLDCSGLGDDPASRRGGARVWLDGAKLLDFPALKMISQLVGMSELNQLQFDQAEANCRLEGTILWIDSIVLTSKDLQVTLGGQYLTDANQLDVHARWTLGPTLSQRVPGFMIANFAQGGSDAPGSRYLDFNITGSLENPKSDIYDRLMSSSVKGLLDNFLTPKPSTPKNKTHEHKSHPSPTPEAGS